MATAPKPSPTFPQPAVPFVDKNGIIARPWLYFLLKLSASADIDIPIVFDLLNKQVASLFVETAMAEIPVVPEMPQLSIGFSLMEATEQTPVAVLNPFLASLMVSG